MRLTFTDAAERELEAIGDYIAVRNPARAVTFIREPRKDCALLTSMPERHPLLSRHETSGIRRRVYGRYLARRCKYFISCMAQWIRSDPLS